VGEVVGLAEVVLNVKDLDESLKFYRDELGLELIGTPPGRAAPVFLKAGRGNAGIPQMVVLVPLEEGSEFLGPRTLHHLALEVEEARFEEISIRLDSLGYDLRMGEHPVVKSWTAYLDDPDGNEVELIAQRT
jgi:catechol 2,3-dioxygenase-like lactoylglutathione lyase family enzyme